MDDKLKIVKVIISAFIILSISSCIKPKLSDTLYRETEVGKSNRTIRCRVLEVREVVIRNDENDQAGGLAGIIIGGTAGSTIGSGTGSILGAELGAVLGGVIGDQVGDKLSERIGLEYSIITGSGTEYTLVQEFLKNDRVVEVGETCRIQVGNDGRNRVLPVRGLPTEIKAPQQTKIISDE